MDAEQDTQLQVDAILNLMDQCRVTAPFLTKNNTTEVAYDRMIYQVVHKKLAEMKQVREGLNALGLADLMDSQPKVTKELFNSVDEATVNFGVLKHRVMKDHMIPAGSTVKISHSSSSFSTWRRHVRGNKVCKQVSWWTTKIIDKISVNYVFKSMILKKQNISSQI